MQIKTTMSYYPTPVKMAITKMPTNNRHQRGCGEREPSCVVGGNVNWCSHNGKQDGDSTKKKKKEKKRKKRTIVWFSNSTSGYFTEKKKQKH